MWPFDPDDSFVTPARAVELDRQHRGLSPEEFALPPTMVATFQAGAYRRLLERAGLLATFDGEAAPSFQSSPMPVATDSPAEPLQPAGIARAADAAMDVAAMLTPPPPRPVVP